MGQISEFFHMCECCSVLLFNNRKRFRPFLAKSDDSNWIRSPKSMFLQFFRFFLSVRGSPRCLTKFSKNVITFYCLEWLNLQKKTKIYFFKNLNFFWKFWKFWKFHFWPKKGSKGFFSEKSDSATFYPLYPPNFMEKIRKN